MVLPAHSPTFDMKKMGVWPSGKCDRIDEGYEEGSTDEGEHRDERIVGQSFTSCDTNEPRTWSEMEYAELMSSVSNVPSPSSSAEDFDAAHPLPPRTWLAQASADLIAKAPGPASQGKRLGRRKSKSLITMAQKAQQNQQQFVFDFRHEAQPPEQHQQDQQHAVVNVAGLEQFPAGPQEPTKASTSRRKAKSLITLAQQQQQRQQNTAMSSEGFSSPNNQCFAASRVAVQERLAASQFAAPGEVQRVAGGYGTAQTRCSGCGGFVESHYKFCLFCGYRLS